MENFKRLHTSVPVHKIKLIYLSIDHIVRSTQSLSPSSNCETPTSDYYSRCSSSLSVDVESLQESMNVSEIDSIAHNMRYDVF